MKVLQVIPTLSAGGAESFIANLGVRLSSIGVEVRIFLLAGVRGERGKLLLHRLQASGVSVSGIEERKPASMANLLALRTLVNSWRPDIVQANMYPAEVACAGVKLLSPGLKTKFVRRLAGTDFCGYRSPMVVRQLNSFFEATVACSPSVAVAFRSFMNNSSLPCATITNGCHLLEKLPNAEDKRLARASLGIQEDKFVIAHIGRMLGAASRTGLESEPKAQDVLLKAYSKAFGGDLSCQLVLLGDGPLRPLVEQLAEELGIAQQTLLLGQQAEPWTCLTAADAFFFPSRNEGMPNALIEAASCGLPVVASDIPEINSLHGDAAWLLKPPDDVDAFAEGLVSLRENITGLSANARAAAAYFRERFSMESCAKNYLDTYQEVLRHGGRNSKRCIS